MNIKILSSGSSINISIISSLLFLLLLLSTALKFVNGEIEIEQRSPRQIIEGGPIHDKEAVLNKECLKSYSATCLKLDMVSFLDKLSGPKSIGIFPGVTVVKENISDDVQPSKLFANLARDFPNDVDKRLDAYLMHKIGTYLNSHSISIKLFDPKTFAAARNFNDEALSYLGWFGQSNNAETARRKDKNGMGTLMAGLMMMKGTLFAMGFAGLAMLAGKAMMTGLMALMLSAIVGLKSLSGGSEKKTTYEVIAKPVYSASHTHSSEEHHAGHGYGHSGYGRSLDINDAIVQESIQKYGNVRDRRSI